MNDLLKILGQTGQAMTFDQIRISIASPEQIRSWSYGEIKKPETINYRTFKPERDGLFCARIFGPIKDYECLCGKYKRMKFRGIICEKCGVEVTLAKVRRERMGHIELASPVAHIWFVKSLPSRVGLMVDMSLKELEKVLYFESYVVLEPGLTDLKLHQLLTEDQLQSKQDEFGDDAFSVGIGAEAVKQMLIRRDLGEEGPRLRAELKETTSEAKRKKLAKRLKVIEPFVGSGARPEWMILDVVPVIPPELRPLVPLSGGRFATSDLNDLYRRVINRNNRLKRLIELSAPDIIVRSEKRMLQEAVDALLDNGARGRAVAGANGRKLMSLTDALTGAGGRFRRGLGGKRVDYSGTSVLVPDPDLRVEQCGLPREMALELFRPFLYANFERLRASKRGRLSERIADYERFTRRRSAPLSDWLEEVVGDRHVLLSSPSTAGRLRVQALEPVLVDGKAVRVHPIIAAALGLEGGADVAVHVPLGLEAQLEARLLLTPASNVLSGATGRPTLMPSREAILGLGYISAEAVACAGTADRGAPILGGGAEVEHALAAGALGVHSKIRIRRADGRRSGDGSPLTVATTAGRALLADLIPAHPSLPAWLWNRPQTAHAIALTIAAVFRLRGADAALRLASDLQVLGCRWATRAGLSGGEGNLDGPEGNTRLNAFPGAAAQQAERRSDLLPSALATSVGATRGVLVHPPGVRPLSTRSPPMVGEAFTTPPRAGGLGGHGWFRAAAGARAGRAELVGRSAVTADARWRLAGAAGSLVVTEEDCGGSRGVDVSELRLGSTRIARLADHIVGRTAQADAAHPRSGERVIRRGQLINPRAAAAAEGAGVAVVRVRSPATCDSPSGVCARCYGLDLARGRPVSIDEPVGAAAALAVGDLHAQLSGRGAPAALRRLSRLLEAAHPRNAAVLSEADGYVRISSANDALGLAVESAGGAGAPIVHHRPTGSRVAVADGEWVTRGQRLTDGPVCPEDVLRLRGVAALTEHFIAEVQRAVRPSGGEVDDRHLEVVLRGMLRCRRVVDAGETALEPGDVVTPDALSKANDSAAGVWGRPASSAPALLGISRAAAASPSFIAAASSGPAKRVLLEAALAGATDELSDPRAGVIVGYLVPLGAGAAARRLRARPAHDRYAPEVKRVVPDHDSGGEDGPGRDASWPDAGDSAPGAEQWLPDAPCEYGDLDGSEAHRGDDREGGPRNDDADEEVDESRAFRSGSDDPVEAWTPTPGARGATASSEESKEPSASPPPARPSAAMDAGADAAGRPQLPGIAEAPGRPEAMPNGGARGPDEAVRGEIAALIDAMGSQAARQDARASPYEFDSAAEGEIAFRHARLQRLLPRYAEVEPELYARGALAARRMADLAAFRRAAEAGDVPAAARLWAGGLLRALVDVLPPYEDFLARVRGHSDALAALRATLADRPIDCEAVLTLLRSNPDLEREPDMSAHIDGQALGGAALRARLDCWASLVRDLARLAAAANALPVADVELDRHIAAIAEDLPDEVVRLPHDIRRAASAARERLALSAELSRALEVGDDKALARLRTGEPRLSELASAREEATSARLDAAARAASAARRIEELLELPVDEAAVAAVWLGSEDLRGSSMAGRLLADGSILADRAALAVRRRDALARLAEATPVDAPRWDPEAEERLLAAWAEEGRHLDPNSPALETWAARAKVAGQRVSAWATVARCRDGAPRRFPLTMGSLEYPQLASVADATVADAFARAEPLRGLIKALTAPDEPDEEAMVRLCASVPADVADVAAGWSLPGAPGRSLRGAVARARARARVTLRLREAAEAADLTAASGHRVEDERDLAAAAGRARRVLRQRSGVHAPLLIRGAEAERRLNALRAFEAARAEGDPEGAAAAWLGASPAEELRFPIGGDDKALLEQGARRMAARRALLSSRSGSEQEDEGLLAAAAGIPSEVMDAWAAQPGQWPADVPPPRCLLAAAARRTAARREISAAQGISPSDRLRAAYAYLGATWPDPEEDRRFSAALRRPLPVARRLRRLVEKLPGSPAEAFAEWDEAAFSGAVWLGEQLAPLREAARVALERMQVHLEVVGGGLKRRTEEVTVRISCGGPAPRGLSFLVASSDVAPHASNCPTNAISAAPTPGSGGSAWEVALAARPRRTAVAVWPTVTVAGVEVRALRPVAVAVEGFRFKAKLVDVSGIWPWSNVELAVRVEGFGDVALPPAWIDWVASKDSQRRITLAQLPLPPATRLERRADFRLIVSRLDAYRHLKASDPQGRFALRFPTGADAWIDHDPNETVEA